MTTDIVATQSKDLVQQLTKAEKLLGEMPDVPKLGLLHKQTTRKDIKRAIYRAPVQGGGNKSTALWQNADKCETISAFVGMPSMVLLVLSFFTTIFALVGLIPISALIPLTVLVPSACGFFEAVGYFPRILRIRNNIFRRKAYRAEIDRLVKHNVLAQQEQVENTRLRAKKLYKVRKKLEPVIAEYESLYPGRTLRINTKSKKIQDVEKVAPPLTEPTVAQKLALGLEAKQKELTQA